MPLAFVGIAIALVVHAAKSATRVAANAVTGGLAAPVLSTAEDGASIVLVVLAIVAPILVAIALVLMIWAFVAMIRRVRRKRREKAEALARAGTAADAQPGALR